VLTRRFWMRDQTLREQEAGSRLCYSYVLQKAGIGKEPYVIGSSMMKFLTVEFPIWHPDKECSSVGLSTLTCAHVLPALHHLIVYCRVSCKLIRLQSQTRHRSKNPS